MQLSHFNVGDPVVFRKQKRSPRPGPRAILVHPNRFGDDYDYMVDKYWVVDSILPDGHLVVRTRRGKRHVIAADDPHLRRATWWHRLFFARRFPAPPKPNQAA